MEQMTPAKAAYEAYCQTRDWKSFDGKPLPQWEDVKDDIKVGWNAAAYAVIGWTQVHGYLR